MVHETNQTPDGTVAEASYLPHPALVQQPQPCAKSL